MNLQMLVLEDTIAFHPEMKPLLKEIRRRNIYYLRNKHLYKKPTPLPSITSSINTPVDNENNTTLECKDTTIIFK